MDTSTKSKNYEHEGASAFPKMKHKSYYSKTRWANLLIKLTIEMAPQTPQDPKSRFFPILLDFL